MYMRLAFAVAAHLEPEILLVDEVLAVGDAEFQKKCLGKMGDVSRQGRTVLFVSHNMAAVNRLCHNAIWLDGGKIQSTGSPQEIVTLYIHTGINANGERQWNDRGKAPGDDRVRLLAARVLDSNQKVTSTLDSKNPFYIEIEYDVLTPLHGMQVGFSLSTSDGVIVFVAGDNEDTAWVRAIRQSGHYKSRCKVPGMLLNSGTYSLGFASDLRNAEILFRCDNALKLDVEQTLLPLHSHTRPAGVICPPLEWHVNKES
jgi:lipopolysaccharide transport system ATP-binding protein